MTSFKQLYAPDTLTVDNLAKSKAAAELCRAYNVFHWPFEFPEQCQAVKAQEGNGQGQEASGQGQDGNGQKVKGFAASWVTHHGRSLRLRMKSGLSLKTCPTLLMLLPPLNARRCSKL